MRKDLNQIAGSIVSQTTKTTEDPPKNPAAVALGRLGGLRGGKARAESLSSEERATIAKNAAKKRWGKKLT